MSARDRLEALGASGRAPELCAELQGRLDVYDRALSLTFDAVIHGRDAEADEMRTAFAALGIVVNGALDTWDEQILVQKDRALDGVGRALDEHERSVN